MMVPSNNHDSRTRGLLILAVLLLGACKSAPPAKKGPGATPVRVAVAQRIDAPVNILASGVVEPMQTVAVTTQVTGSLLDVDFHEGDIVQKGQVLFHIDPRPLQATLDQVRATLSRDEAQAEAGRKDDERYRKLADMGYVSRSQSDQMHATAEAQAATVRADQAALRAAQVNLGFATIRAPISGRTGSLLVRQGNNVSPGAGPLVVINQLSPVLVRFPVLAQDFAGLQRAVSLGAVQVRAAAGDSVQTYESGTLNFLDNAIDSLTGTVTGKAQFENAGHRMWPGELVFLTVQESVLRNVIAVPTTAIQTGQQGAYVYVVDNTMKATTRPVTSGLQVGELTVVASGLNAGERVVTDGQSKLNPGSKVAIITNGDTSRTRLATGNTDTSSGTGQANGEVAQGTNAGGTGFNPRANGGAGQPTGGGRAGGASVAGGVSAGAVQPGAALPPTIVRSGTGATTTPTSATPNPAASTTPIVTPPTTTAPGAAISPATTTGRPPTTTTTTTTTTGRPPATGTTTGGRP